MSEKEQETNEVTYPNNVLDRIEVNKTGQTVTIYFKNGNLLTFEPRLVISNSSIESKILNGWGKWDSDKK